MSHSSIRNDSWDGSRPLAYQWTTPSRISRLAQLSTQGAGVAVWRHGRRGHSGQYGRPAEMPQERSRAVAGDGLSIHLGVLGGILGAIDMSHTPQLHHSIPGGREPMTPSPRSQTSRSGRQDNGRVGACVSVPLRIERQMDPVIVRLAGGQDSKSV